ncbi:MAG: hypothetical protein QM751_05215 [Paludibacteraceae bacterium]
MTDLFGTVSKYKLTAEGLEEVLLQTKPEEFKLVFKKYTDIELTDDELKSLLSSKNYKADNYMEAAKGENMTHYIVSIMASRTNFGFTTYGHTGEEVFLAAYHPKGTLPMGNMRNTEFHKYLYKATGLKTPLAEFNATKYAKHTDVFMDTNYKIEVAPDKSIKLIVKKRNNTLEVPAFSSVATLNGKSFDMGSVAVYVDKNNTFYLPKSLAYKLK